jgi:hypothetical protein
MRTKIVAIVVAVLLTATFSGAVFAQEWGTGERAMFQKALAQAKLMEFDGKVLSHDVACHCIVVETAKGTLTMQDDYTKFDQEYDRAKGLMVGAHVMGTYKTVQYINYALDLKVK